MQENVKFETITTGVKVTSNVCSKTLVLGDTVDGIEVCSIVVKRTPVEVHIRAYDEDEKLIYKLDVMNPLVIEEFQKTIAVDGPVE